MPPSSTPSASSSSRRQHGRAAVVGCGQGWMWPRSLQSASLSAVPMQRRAGKPPITASTCILLAARSQWRLHSTNTLGLDAVSSSFSLSFSLVSSQCSLPVPEGLLRLVRSNESTARPSLPSLAPSAPPGFTPLSGSASKVGTKGSQRQASSMHIMCAWAFRNAQSGGDWGPWQKAVMMTD